MLLSLPLSRLDGSAAPEPLLCSSSLRLMLKLRLWSTDELIPDRIVVNLAIVFAVLASTCHELRNLVFVACPLITLDKELLSHYKQMKHRNTLQMKEAERNCPVLFKLCDCEDESRWPCMHPASLRGFSKKQIEEHLKYLGYSVGRSAR